MRRFQRPAGWGDLSPVRWDILFSAIYWYREGPRWILRAVAPLDGIYELEGSP